MTAKTPESKSYTAHVVDGVITLDESVTLPEGAELRVMVSSHADTRSSVHEQQLDAAGNVKGISKERVLELAREFEESVGLAPQSLRTSDDSSILTDEDLRAERNRHWEEKYG